MVTLKDDEGCISVVRDVVEVGHLPLIGGTVDVELIYKGLTLSDHLIKHLRKYIDLLDHTVIIDRQNIKMKKYSDRYILIDSSGSFQRDVADIMCCLTCCDVVGVTSKKSTVILNRSKNIINLELSPELQKDIVTLEGSHLTEKENTDGN